MLFLYHPLTTDVYLLYSVCRLQLVYLMTTVIITEKKDVADNMAKAMGWSRVRDSYEGYLNGKPVKAVWARGHLLTLAEPDKSIGWNDPVALEHIPRATPIVPIIEKEPTRNSAKNLLDNIKIALSRATEVILATDCDREGEYIGWLILEHLNCTVPVRRCWLASGMDERSIKQSLTDLLPDWEKKPLARAAEARARSDWAYMFLVRAMTFYGRKGHMGKLLGTGAGRESVVSVGRVQSAALFMIYKREMEIRNFKPKDFHSVLGNFSVIGNLLQAEYAPQVTQAVIDAGPPGVHWEPQGLEGENKLDKPVFIDKALVEQFSQRLMLAADQARVDDYKEGTREQHPPITYDLVEAKSALSGKCGVTGDVAQAVIEDLYEQGFISYPRTAHGELPMGLYRPDELNPRLNVVMAVPGLEAAAQRALAIHGGTDKAYKQFTPKVFVNKKLEHYGLIPSTKEVSAKILADMQPRKQGGGHTAEHMRAAYILIATRYVQAMLPPAKLATQKITFAVPVQDLLNQPTSIFIAKAQRTIDPGWREIMAAGENKASELPKLSPGQAARLESVEIKTGKTKAPGRYSEQNIEKALQKAAREVDDPKLRAYLADGSDKPEGIGTPSSRKDIIPTLKVRGYIRADKSATFYLEEKGEEFINFQMKHNHDWLYRIETTAQWEGKLSDIALLSDDRKASELRDSFVEETLGNIEQYIRWLNSEFLEKSPAREQPETGAPTQVTDRMKSAIKSIAERKNIPVPRGALSNPLKAKEFLDEHAPKQPQKPSGTEQGTPNIAEPSQAQRDLAEKLAKLTGNHPTPEEMADRRKLSAYIDRNKPAEVIKPPTDKMIKFAEDIAKKLPDKDKPSADVFKSWKACNEFISKNKNAL